MFQLRLSPKVYLDCLHSSLCSLSFYFFLLISTLCTLEAQVLSSYLGLPLSNSSCLPFTKGLSQTPLSLFPNLLQLVVSQSRSNKTHLPIPNPPKTHLKMAIVKKTHLPNPPKTHHKMAIVEKTHLPKPPKKARNRFGIML